MFDNVGEKIKKLAKVLLWLGIIVSIIVALYMFSIVDDAPIATEGFYRMLGFAFLFIGPLSSWISSILVYGFGELVETNCKIADGFDEVIKPNNKIAKSIQNNQNNSSNNNTVAKSSRVNSSTATHQPEESVQISRGNCGICDKQDVDVRQIKIVDEMGTSYINACDECARKYNCSH